MIPKTAGLLLLGLAASVSCENRASDGFHHPIDVSEDLYHRIRSGVFQPEREPLVLTLVSDLRDLRRSAVAASAPLRIRTELGSLRVRSNARGRVVLYMNEGTVFTHLELAPHQSCAGVVREFPRRVVHPIL